MSDPELGPRAQELVERLREGTSVTEGGVWNMDETTNPYARWDFEDLMTAAIEASGGDPSIYYEGPEAAPEVIAALTNEGLREVYPEASQKQANVFYNRFFDVNGYRGSMTVESEILKDAKEELEPTFVIRDLDVPDVLDPAEFGYDVPSRDEIG